MLAGVEMTVTPSSAKAGNPKPVTAANEARRYRQFRAVIATVCVAVSVALVVQKFPSSKNLTASLTQVPFPIFKLIIKKIVKRFLSRPR